MDEVELRVVLRVIWKRLWLIVLGPVLVAALAHMTREEPIPIYRARVTLMVNQPSNTTPASFKFLSTAEDLALTYSKLLRARPLLETVIANLNLDLSPGYLKGQLDTYLIKGTQLLELTVKDTDPQRAADIANELAYTFIFTHNSEQQLEKIVDFEEYIAAQMVSVQVFIEQNQSAIDRMGIPSDPLLAEELNRLQSTLASQQSTYASLLGTYMNMRLAQTELLDVSVVEPAVVPGNPIGAPSTSLFVMLGAFVGLSVSGGLVFLWEYLDQSFETGDDVTQILGLPTLGTIPRRRGVERESKLVTFALPHALITEAYRGLRTSVRYSSVDQPLKTLLITSADPGAGKTSVSANLGVVCAQAGLQVVLIDGDLRSPKLHRLFNLGNQTGLTDLLVGDIPQITDCILETGVNGLRLIASGPIPPNPSELLGSKRMETMLAQVSEDADLVILDAPPALPVTDPLVLAVKTDGVIIVVEAKRTSHDAARRTLEALEGVGANILGVALTKAKTDSGQYYYYNTEPQSGLRTKWKQWRRLLNFRGA